MYMSHKTRGFTLFELMLVIVILGVLAGLSTLAVGDRRNSILISEAEKLKAIITILRQEAMLYGGPVALEITESGYRQLVWEYESQKWQVSDAAMAVDIMFADSVHWDQVPQKHYIFESDEDQNEDKINPDIFISPDTEVKPFELTMKFINSQQRVRIKGQGYGAIQIMVD